MPSDLTNPQVDIEVVPPSRRSVHAYWNDRQRRHGVRIAESAPESKAGRDSHAHALATISNVIKLVVIAGDNQNAYGLLALQFASHLLDTVLLYRERDSGSYRNWYNETREAVNYAIGIINHVINNTFVSDSTLKPIDITWNDYQRALIVSAVYPARWLHKCQSWHYDWFNAQAQAHTCNNCGGDKRIGWHEVRDGVDGVMCESMTVLDDDVEIEF